MTYDQFVKHCEAAAANGSVLVEIRLTPGSAVEFAHDVLVSTPGVEISGAEVSTARNPHTGEDVRLRCDALLDGDVGLYQRPLEVRG